MQVDGEACKVNPSIIYLKFLNKAAMLAKRKGAKKVAQYVLSFTFKFFTCLKFVSFRKAIVDNSGNRFLKIAYYKTRKTFFESFNNRLLPGKNWKTWKKAIYFWFFFIKTN